MGNDLTSALSTGSLAPLIPWLESETDALVRDLIATLAERHPDLLAIIIYGSVARHDERTLSDPYPSDVDLLAIFDTDDEHVAVHQGEAIFHSIGLAKCRHLDAPREVQVMLASRTLGEWDPTFVANVARDGRVLFVRGHLPAPFSQSEAAGF
jgi:predicted nucleotidyltransferase